ncbi:MAG: carbohydrate ABC transporter permease [Cetobacterium sp.]
MKSKITLIQYFQYLFLIIASFLSLFPFYWLIIGTTNSTNEIMNGKLTLGNYFLENYNSLIKFGGFEKAFVNTVKITLIYVFLTLIITSLAAYGFDKFKTFKTEFIYKVFILSMMIPFAAIMIPLFRIMVKLNLIDSFLAVILPGLSSIFLIFFFRQSLKSFPNQIIESARIDGASELTIFFKIVIPPMRPTFAAAAIYAFMNQWNNYMWPLIVLRSNENKTLTLSLSSMSSAYFVDYGMLMLGIVISTIPMIIIFFSMQKSFVQGMTGSSK